MSKTEKKEKYYLAPFIVHWSTGPVACCEKHANALLMIAKTLGIHVGTAPNLDPLKQCENCKNEDK